MKAFNEQEGDTNMKMVYSTPHKYLETILEEQKLEPIDLSVKT